jgi:hypothetical protein
MKLQLNLTVCLIAIKVAVTFIALYFLSDHFSLTTDEKNYVSGHFVNQSTAHSTMIIQRIVSFSIPKIGEFGTNAMFSILSIGGFLYYINFDKKNGDLNIAWILLLPSSLIWTSIIGKESISYLALSIMIFSWINIIKDNSRKINYGVIIISFLVYLVMRPHYAFGVTWIFISSYLLYNKHSKLTLLCFFSIYFFLFLYFINPVIIERASGCCNALATTNRHDLFNIKSLEDFKSIVPLGFIFGIIGPLPNELSAKTYLIPFFIEGLLILFFPLLCLHFTINHSNFNKNNIFYKHYLYSLSPSLFLLMIIHSPLGILNLGSAIRWRTNFELFFYLIPLLLTNEILNPGKADEKNSTLSSK